MRSSVCSPLLIALALPSSARAMSLGAARGAISGSLAAGQENWQWSASDPCTARARIVPLTGDDLAAIRGREAAAAGGLAQPAVADDEQATCTIRIAWDGRTSADAKAR